MNKARIIFICTGVLIVVSLLTYLNYDKILNYFTNKEWEIADSVGKIEIGNYLNMCGTNSNFFVIDSEGITGYSNIVKENFSKGDLAFKDVISESEADYAIIVDKDTANVYAISGNEIVWNTHINNANILGAYINKNGYAAVIYSQTGYKSLIKVFSNTGEELFTNFLASTYAIDVAISNDNKILAIAEIDTNGINVESRIKFVDIKNASENSVKKYNLNANELITDIEFGEANRLIIMTDIGIKSLKDEKINDVLNYEDEGILIANISNKKNIVAVRAEKEGLFNATSQLCIYDFNTQIEPKICEIEDIPNNVVCQKNIIAADTGTEILFFNDSGKFLKKCEYKGQLRDIKFFDNGNMAVLIFRDFVDFIKVGGI